MKTLISSLFVLLLFTACKQAEAPAEAAVDSTVAAAKMMRLPDADAEVAAATNASYDSYSEKAAATYENPNDYSKIEAKIIKNATLRFETNDIEATDSRVKAAVSKYKATIQNDSEGKDYQSIYKNITIRIPNQNFDAFLADLSKGVAYFDTKEISSEDVTEEYIDVDARLKAKKVLETRYFELLKKASKVSEMIEIEKQLSEIREEIEAKEGQLRYMKNRIALSTVNIEFYKSTATEAGATVSYGGKIWNALKSGFNSISTFFIGLIEMWPLIIILVAVIFFIRKRFLKKRTRKNENIS